MRDFAINDFCDIESTLTFRKFFKCFISFDDFIDFLFIQFEFDKFKKHVNQMKKTKNNWNWNSRSYIDAKNTNSNFSIMTTFCQKIKSINMMKRSIFFAKIRFFWLIKCFSFWSIVFFYLTFFLIWRICVFFLIYYLFFILIDKHAFSKSCYLYKTRFL